MIVDRPLLGFYRAAFVRGGPWCPVLIVKRVARDPVTDELLDRSPVLVAIVGDAKPSDPCLIWSWCAGHPITHREYDYLVRLRKWATAYDLSDPAALGNERTPIDVGRLPAAF